MFAERRIFTIGYNSDYKREYFAEIVEFVKKSLESEQQAELLDRDRGGVSTLGTQVDQSHSGIVSESFRLRRCASTRHEVHDDWHS